MRYLLLFALLAGSAQAGGIIQGGIPPSPLGGPSTFTVVNASTVTITGTGSKCFSVADPTLVVDCNLQRVGIGTASPGSKLDILDAGYGEIIRVGSGANRLGLGVNAGGAGYCGGIYVGGTLGGTFCNGGLALGAAVTNPAANTLYVANVGIGTYAPATKLHMSSGTLTLDGNSAIIDITERATGNNINLSNGVIAAGSYGVNNLLAGPSNGMYASAGSQLAFRTASTDRVTIQSGGNVGIGTASPATTLDVNGNAQFGSGPTKSTFTATGALTLATGAPITVSSAAFIGVYIATQAAGGAGVSVTAVCSSPTQALGTTFALGGGCICTGGVGVTGNTSAPDTLTAGSIARGWTCQEPGGTGGACSAYAICSRAQ